MLQITTVKELREQLQPVRTTSRKIGLVPTMGNLHAGHLSLVDIARQHADFIVVTIFVNPSQFVAGEDFEHYPRTLEADLQLLAQQGVDMVFTPAVNEVYPTDSKIATEVTVPGWDAIYCGASRPGHFKGVATVVTKLLNMVQPHVSVFGEKDYQQLLVIRHLVEDLNIPVEVIGAPIIREEDGLAMSSRNQYLNEAERKQASKLYECLQQMADSIKKGNKEFAELEEKATQTLKDAGFNPDYVSICDANTLESPAHDNIVIIAAAWLGKARLIDNVAVQTYD